MSMAITVSWYHCAAAGAGISNAVVMCSPPIAVTVKKEMWNSNSGMQQIGLQMNSHSYWLYMDE